MPIAFRRSLRALTAALFATLACLPGASPAQTLENAELGSTLTNTLDMQWAGRTYKGIMIRLGGKDGKAAVCYDQDLLRCSGGWVGGGGQGWQAFFDPKNSTSFTAFHGGPPLVRGEVKFATPVGPGWAKPGSEDVADPRAEQAYPEKRKLGPLPKEWAHYKGLYVNGERVVVSYTVGDCPVLETPGLAGDANAANPAFTRTVRVGKSDKPLTLVVCGLADGKGGVGKAGEAMGAEKAGPAAETVAVLDENGHRQGTHTAAGLVNAPAGAAWAVEGGRVLLKLPARNDAVTFKLVVWSGPKGDLAKFKDVLAGSRDVEDIEALTKGGPVRWTPELTTEGVVAPESSTEAYVADVITAPATNPWNSFLRFGGVDFFSDGKRAALCTIGGDVWVVSGLDDPKLSKLTWKRFATGLFQPLGLKVVDDKVYTTGRNQITRLHDLNNDGEADFYENFNSDTFVTENYHEFCLDLQTDSDGNFYYAKGAPWSPDVRSAHQGVMFKVSKDGSKLEVIATGLRAPNGLGMSPKNQLTCSDNQGHWMPSSKVNLIQPGKFYGMMQTAHLTPPPTDFEKPLLWLPMNMDNSSGGQVWAAEGWGPLGGNMLHLSYGQSRMFNVMTEEVEGVMQGAAVAFPLKFESSAMRARVNKADGQVYLCGLKGWQTNAAKEGALHRVRFTGKPSNMPTKFNATKNGVFITFASPLDKAEAADAGNYGVEQWNYKWTGNYGSPEFSAADANQAKHDTVEVKSAKVSADGKTVFLEIPGIKPVMQMKLKVNLVDAADKDFTQEIYATIHKLGPERGL